MSAWPEAVWIVKQLKKYFNINDLMNSYTIQLNDVRARMNTAIGNLNTDQAKLEAAKVELKNKIYTIAAKSANSSNTKPENIEQSDYNRDTIWFVLENEPGIQG